VPKRNVNQNVLDFEFIELSFIQTFVFISQKRKWKFS
jgi:hypothetical protein